MKNKAMKTFLLITSASVILAFFTGCATYKPEMLSAPDKKIEKKIHRLEVKGDRYTIKPVPSGMFYQNWYNDNYFVMLNNEIQKNICENEGKIYGSVEFRIVYDNTGEINYGLCCAAFAGGTFCIAPLLGLPFGKYDQSLKVLFTISDADGKLVKEYEYSEERAEWFGIYYGHGDARTLRVEMFRGFIDKFKSDVQRDSAYINAVLEKKKPVEEKRTDQDGTGTYIGEVESVTNGEVIVRGTKISDKVKMGDKLVVISGDKKIVLNVTFPMMTAVKCKVSTGSIRDIKPGDKVYKP